MLRVLLESNAKHLHFTHGSVVSVVAHASLIGLAVVGSGTNRSLRSDDPTEQKITYLVPIDRSVHPPPQQEQVAWVDPGADAGTGGLFKEEIIKTAPIEKPVAGLGPEEGSPKQEAEAVAEVPALPDSVPTALEVDSAVTRYSDSAAPVYPQKLLEKKVEGGAYVQFIVDTTGLADVSSFRVISSSHPEFARAVLDALPHMRFRPAIMASKKVRQLVEQPFMFKIIPATPAAKPVP